MIQKRKQDSAVSPVVGVILMVAVTVILAAVIGNFVLNLGSSVQEPPQASVGFTQDYDFNGVANPYSVRVAVNSMSNADFLHTTVTGKVTKSDSGSSTNIKDDGVTSSSQDVPENAEADESGDAPTVDELNAGDIVQVVGVLEGEEAVVGSYEVRDTQG